MSNPAVSILVPVYNTERYLRRFLDSVIGQDFKDFELIAVDGRSTDSSWDILLEYKEKFPDIVFPYQVSADLGYTSPAQKRNIAYGLSRGEYIYHCDSDDMLQLQAIGKMYDEATKHDCDLIVASGYVVEEDVKGNTAVRKYYPKKNAFVNNQTAILGSCEFWLRLVKRSLIEKVGEVPGHLFVLEDVAYVIMLHSYAEKIRYISHPVYYFFHRADSTSTKRSQDIAQASLDAAKYCMEHSNPAYREVIEIYLARRSVANVSYRWRYRDLFIQDIKDNYELLQRNALVQKDKRLLRSIESFEYDLPEEKIPSRVYIDGFSGVINDEFVEHLRENVFCDETKIVLLNSSTCDVLSAPEEVQQALKSGHTKFAAKYFALKQIYENGGVFISDEVKMTNSLGYLSFYQGFFALLDKENYSESIFGALPGNEVFEKILETYLWKWSNKPFLPLRERIKLVMMAVYDYRADGISKYYQKDKFPITILGPSFVAVDTSYGNFRVGSLCEHDFSRIDIDREMLTIPYSVLDAILKEKVYPHKKREQQYKKKLDKVNSELLATKKKIAGIRNSKSWKFVRAISHLGKPFKSISDFFAKKSKK